jgi:2-oxoisovalerate dehydrogenase E1 component
MEDFFFPQPEWIIDAVHAKIIPLKGHTSKTDQSAGRFLKLNREGV